MGSTMDSPSITMLAAIICLVIMSAYFSATETAFTSLNRVRLRSKAEGGNRRAALALERRTTTACSPPS